MSTIPEHARGYRKGYRRLVTALHDQALVQSDYRIRKTLNHNAYAIAYHAGLYRALEKRDITAARAASPTSNAAAMAPGFVERNTLIAQAAKRNATSSKWNAAFLTGYLEGLDDALTQERHVSQSLVDPRAAIPVQAFDEQLQNQLNHVLNGKLLLSEFVWNPAPVANQGTNPAIREQK